METIKEAKVYLRENWEKGVKCPACGQLVKRYVRKLNSGMARILIEIYKATYELDPPDGWMHIHKVMTARKFNATNMEYSKLKYWGLIQSKNESGLPDKKSTGFWKITEKGREFVRGKISVKSHIVLSKSHSNRLIGFEGDDIFIGKALGEKFNYVELMGELNTYTEESTQQSLI